MTIHQAACPQLVSQLAQLGLPVSEILAEAGLHPIHARGEDRAPLGAFMTAKGIAARRLDDPHLGLRLASMTRVDELGVFGAALVHAPTIGHALAIGVEFLSVWAEGIRLVVSHGAKHFTLTYVGVSIADPLAEQIEAQQTLLFLADVLRHLGGPGATPQRLACACPAPSSPRSSRPPHLPGREWRFDAREWSIEMPRDIVGRPLSVGHPAVPMALRQNLERERQREALPGEPELIIRVDDAIRRGLFHRWTQADVAAALGMSVRSLQKHLQAKGTSYSKRLDAVRIELAAKLLRDTEMSVEEICHRIGFDSLPGFSRFFAMQTGTPPSHYRRNG